MKTTLSNIYICEIGKPYYYNERNLECSYAKDVEIVLCKKGMKDSKELKEKYKFLSPHNKNKEVEVYKSFSTKDTYFNKNDIKSKEAIRCVIVGENLLAIVGKKNAQNVFNLLNIKASSQNEYLEKELSLSEILDLERILNDGFKMSRNKAEYSA